MSVAGQQTHWICILMAACRPQHEGASWVLMALVVERLPLMGAILIVMASNALGMINIVFGTIFQQLPPRQMIGRVNTVNLSLMAIASLGGSLLGGIVVPKFNSVFPFLICGLGYLVIAMTMRVNRLVCTLPKTEDMDEQILSVDEGLQINARKRSKTRKKY